jgi:hypothetical protein
VDNRDRDTLQEAQRDETLLTVPEPAVFVSDGQSCENPPRVDEIEAVRSEVGSTLLLIPLEPHLQSVYTRSGEGNARAAV